ncbi:MAG: glycosyltransferase, partial [Kiritimatiellae bacterium]|nr:glycosyltransferase [Kiritimatiellia bacterium]
MKEVAREGMKEVFDSAIDVSVVIPTHRRHLFLKAALQSVFKQKGVGFEVIVVNGIENDADTDAVVSGFGGVNYIRSKEYLSCSSKRALGLSLAKGRYIHFIDDDDYLIDDDFYRKAVAMLDSNGDISSFSGNTRFRFESAEGGEPTYSDAAPLLSGRIDGLEYFSKFQLEWGKPDLMATVFRKAALVADGTLQEVNDSSIYLQSLLHGDAFIIEDRVCVYRKWGGSISHGGEGNDLRLKMDTAIQKECFYRIAAGKIADADKWWRGTFVMNLNYFKRSTPDVLEMVLLAAWGILHSHGDGQLAADCAATLASARPGAFACLPNISSLPRMLLHLRAALHKVFLGVSVNYEPYYSQLMVDLDAEIRRNSQVLDLGMIYFTGFRNFGDLLGRNLVEYLCGLRIGNQPFTAADISSVGSLLQNLPPGIAQAQPSAAPLHVWGSGFLYPAELDKPQAKGRVVFHAVRGRKTLALLRETGHVDSGEPVALGDPGLLYADLIPGAEKTEKEFDVAIVPHLLDSEEFKAVAGELASQGLSVKFVDVHHANPMQVVRDIAASRKVLSSSLHGIIVADSLGIPNRRIVVDGFETDEMRMRNESDFKFADYYSAFGLECPERIRLSELKSAPRKTIERVVDFVPQDKVEECKRKLLAAFPFPRREPAAAVQNAPQSPDISVIIPICNSEYYLRECIDSVLLQEQFTSIELICVDDGSTDSSAAIVEAYAAGDRRVKLIRQANAGPGVARNAGLDVARGEYIFFLDADDRLSSGAALREAFEQAKADDIDILLADGDDMSEIGKTTRSGLYLLRDLLPTTRVFPPESLGANLYVVATMSPWAKLFRRQFLEKNALRFPALKRSEDFPFVQLAMSLARRIGAKLRPAVDHRIGVATSLESTKDETPLIFAEAERIFRNSLSERGLLDKFMEADNVAHAIYIAYNLRRLRRFSGFRAVAQYCAKVFPGLGLKGDETSIFAFTWVHKRLSSITAAANDTDSLADIFAEIQVAARKKASRDSTKEVLAAKDATLKQLRDRTAQLRETAEKQRETIATRDANLGKLRDTTAKLRDTSAQLRGMVERQRENAEKQRENAETQREAIAARDAALAKLRDTSGKLRGMVERQRENTEKQREAIAARDAALAKLRDTTAQLRGTVERQRENAEKQREAIAARDAALAKLRDTSAQLRGMVERQRENAEKQRENAETQREAIAARDAALA